MALPIRLIVGPSNIMEIPLEAQSVDITVNRNASAFPTPNNIVGRVAIDTNIPEIDIEISGIFQDDDSATFDIEKTTPKFGGGDIVFNFASIFPTTVGRQGLWSGRIEPLQSAFDNAGWAIARFKKDFKISSETTDTIDIYDIDGVTANDFTSTNRGLHIDEIESNLQSPDRSAVNHPSSGTYSAGSTTIVVDNATVYFSGQRVHLSNGTFVGKITSRTNVELHFSGGTKVNLPDNTELYVYRATLWSPTGRVVGSIIDANINSDFKLTNFKLDEIAVPIYENLEYYLTFDTEPPIERLLNNKKISLYPNFWRIDSLVSTLPNIPLGVHLVFSNETAHADYQNQKSGGTQIAGTYPTVTNNGQHYAEYNDAGDRIAGEGYGVYLKLPIGGITTHAVNGNPASTLALIVKKALELTTDVMDEGYITSTNGQTLASAFEVTIGGPMLKVKQKDRPIKESLLSNIEPCLQFDVSENFDVTDEGTIEPAMIQFFTGPYIVNSVSVNAKSAGDKVQDLMGLISNAKKNKDLIRGIQVPYDSLIQSDAVTPTARNFFLTFGQQDNDAKGSSGNTLSASHRMVPQLLPGDLGGETSPDDESSFFDNFGEFGDAVQAIGSFVGNFIGDTFVTLRSDPHGNDGGIRIIPEKFHVHYDAGNKYYAYKLILKASDFVIGV
tara:strand:+ start:19258 stop:21264 length:2007 start_codon:yes stop_codon:yes gene_type:complete